MPDFKVTAFANLSNKAPAPNKTNRIGTVVQQLANNQNNKVTSLVEGLYGCPLPKEQSQLGGFYQQIGMMGDAFGNNTPYAVPLDGLGLPDVPMMGAAGGNNPSAEEQNKQLISLLTQIYGGPLSQHPPQPVASGENQQGGLGHSSIPPIPATNPYGSGGGYTPTFIPLMNGQAQQAPATQQAEKPAEEAKPVAPKSGTEDKGGEKIP